MYEQDDASTDARPVRREFDVSNRSTAGISTRARLAVATTALAMVAASGRADPGTVGTVIYGIPSDNTPRSRTWSGTAWNSESLSLDVGGAPRWIVAKNCPTRNELIVACIDNQEDCNAFVYNGTAWSNLIEASTTLFTASERPMYIEYEQQSGDALLVYRVGSDSTAYYRTWNGASWSAQNSTVPPGNGDAKFCKLVPKPASNEIMLLVLDNNRDLSALVWNGSSFDNAVLLDSDAAFTGCECMDAAYEGQSGRCIVAWARNGTTVPKYRIWNGTAWLAEGSLPDVGGNTRWMRLAADPASDKLIAMTLDGVADINLIVWSGSAWGSTLEVQTSNPDTNRRGFDVAFEPNGTRALALYGRSAQSNVYYRTYDGANWSAEQTGPDISQPPSVIQLSPATGGSEILVGIERKNDGAFGTLRWTGSSLQSYQVLASDLAGPNGNECFMLTRSPASAPPRIVSWREVPNPDPETP